MIELNEQQRQAIQNGEAVRIPAPEIGAPVVLLREDVYERLRRTMEEVDPSLYEFEDSDHP